MVALTCLHIAFQIITNSLSGSFPRNNCAWSFPIKSTLLICYLESGEFAWFIEHTRLTILLNELASSLFQTFHFH